MKRVSSYILIIIVASVAVISWWIFQKYFKTVVVEPISFHVERGDIEEAVKVRGEVINEKDFDLGFTFAGTVSGVFVEEGQIVSLDTPLIRLDTVGFELEKKNLEAILAQKEASLEKLLAGATIADVRIYETKVEGAETALKNAKKILVDKLEEAFTKADDGVRNKTDQLFDSPSQLKTRVKSNISDAQLRNDLELERMAINKTLQKWSAMIASLNLLSELNSQLAEAYKNLDEIKIFLNKASLAVNSLTANIDNSQATLDTWRLDVSTARTNVNLAISNLSSADDALGVARSALRVAQKELEFKISAARTEDVSIAKAVIEEVKSKIAIIDDNIRKSTLYAPAESKVVKVYLESKEPYVLGTTAISLSTTAHKIRADISELDIGKIRSHNGGNVSIKFDALPDEIFGGKVVSIDPKEIVKDEDKYYRVNLAMGKHSSLIRTGMNADLSIVTSSKKDVLKIPELAVSKKYDQSFVVVLRGGQQREIPIRVGISDGDFVEVLSGLAEGETLIISAD